MNYQDLSNNLKDIRSQAKVLLVEKEAIWEDMKKESVVKFHKEPAIYISNALVRTLDDAINLAEIAYLSWQD